MATQSNFRQTPTFSNVVEGKPSVFPKPDARVINFATAGLGGMMGEKTTFVDAIVIIHFCFIFPNYFLTVFPSNLILNKVGRLFIHLIPFVSG